MLRVLFLALRFIFILFVIRMVLRMLFPRAGYPRGASSEAGGSRASRGPRGPRVPERAGGELVRDPKCGTYVAKTSAHRLQSGGETMYFCSTTCRDGWLAERPASGARPA